VSSDAFSCTPHNDERPPRKSRLTMEEGGGLGGGGGGEGSPCGAFFVVPTTTTGTARSRHRPAVPPGGSVRPGRRSGCHTACPPPVRACCGGGCSRGGTACGSSAGGSAPSGTTPIPPPGKHEAIGAGAFLSDSALQTMLPPELFTSSTATIASYLAMQLYSQLSKVILRLSHYTKRLKNSSLTYSGTD